MSKTKYYIDNKRFEKLIVLYKEDSKTYEEELMEMLDLLITNVFHTFNFQIEFDDARQECYLLILKTLKNFSPDKGSAFNYFTTIIVNNLKLIYTKDKKYKNRIEEYTEIFLPKSKIEGLINIR